MDLQLAITVVLLASANVGCTRTFLYIKNDERESAEGDRLDTKRALALLVVEDTTMSFVGTCVVLRTSNFTLIFHFELHVRTFYVLYVV